MTDDRKRKRTVRALMAETGLKYRDAARQVDEEWARSQAESERVQEAPTSFE